MERRSLGCEYGIDRYSILLLFLLPPGVTGERVLEENAETSAALKVKSWEEACSSEGWADCGGVKVKMGVSMRRMEAPVPVMLLPGWAVTGVSSHVAVGVSG
jgi:hypothetical protein